MFCLYALLMILGAYLLGSVNFAIIITRRLSSRDIRELGTGNPGTANVGRNFGKGWGALVYFLDLAKGMVPLLLGKIVLFPGDSPREYVVLAAVGIAAIAGHCRPVFHRFKGGGGIATSMGVFFFFIPVEFFASVLLGFTAAMLFLRQVRFRLGQWTPILFVTITPFLTLALNWLFDVPLFSHISIGGHPWYMLAGIFLTSFFILGMNLSFLKNRVTEMQGGGAGGH